MNLAHGHLFALLTVAITGCGSGVAIDPAASRSPDRVFTLLGSESTGRLLPERGSTVASDVSRDVRDVAELPDGRIVVLTAAGKIDIIDGHGRISRVPTAFPRADEGARDLDVTVDGALLVVTGGQLWRVDLSGRSTPLTPAVVEPEELVIEEDAFDPGVLAVDALPDAGYVYTESKHVWRVAPDGARIPLAGSGRFGEPKPGPALQTALQWPVRVAALDDGRVVFVDESPLSGASSSWVVADGTVRSSRLSKRGGAQDLLALDGGRLAVLADGVRVLGGGLVVGTAFDPSPLWAGLRASRVSIGRAAAIAATASGDWLVATREGIAMVTTSANVPRRLAVAVHLDTRSALRRGEVRVASTRAATVQVAAGKSVVARGRVTAGVTSLRLSRRLPDGETVLRLRATGDDGAVASHRLSVMVGRTLPLASARQAALDSAWDFGGDIQPYVERCRRLNRRTVSCWVSGAGERWVRGRLRLRDDGWIWVSWGGRAYRTGPR